MKNHEGALSFEAYISKPNWNKDIRSMNQDIDGMARNTLSQTEKMGLGFRNLSTLAAGALAGIGLAQLPGQLVKIRGEFQQLEIAFSTMLGSKAKADKLMAQVAEFAALTPYGLSDTAEATKMLLAYGAQADTVIDTMRRLGDIASGINAPLKDIAYLYGTTMTQGRLYTQDLNQFLGRGIPMLRELSEIFGVGESEVKGLVEAGKVGFPEVQKVIQNLTKEGSMFGGLMEEQSKSLVGLQAQLGDAVDAMFNDIGKSQEGLLSETFKGAIAVVENYEKVIDILKVVVATYGTYRAALMLTAAMQASTGLVANIKLWVDLARSVNNAKDAQILFNLATKANPYVIAATALAALVAGFVVFGREASNAEKIQNSLNEAMRKAEDSAAAEQAKIQTLTTRIKNETSSRQDRNKALQELIQLSPEHLGALSLENIATEKGTEAINNYIEAKKKQLELKEIETQLEESIKRQNSAKNQDSDLSIFDKIGISLAASGSRGEVNYSKSVAAERKRLNDDLLKQEEDVQEKLRKRIETLTGVSDATKKTGTEADAVTRKTVSWYEEEITALKKKQEAQSEDREAYLKYQKQIDDLERKRDAITGGKQKKVAEKDKPQPYGSLAYWEEVASKANEVLSKTPAGNTSVLRKQQDIIIQAEKQIAEIRKSIAVKSFEEEIAEKQRQYELYERWVQHMGEDAAKEQFSTLLTNGASFSDFLNAEIAKLTSEGTKTNFTEEETKQLDALKTLFNDFTGATSPMEKFQKTLDDVRDSSGSLTEEITRLKEIQDSLDPNDNSSTGYEKRQVTQKRLNEAVKERKYLLEDFLRSVAGSEERRLAIEKRYADLRNDLNEKAADKKAAGYLKALKAIDDAEKEALEEDKDEAARKSKEYKAFVKIVEKQHDELRKIDLVNARRNFKEFTANLDRESDEYEEHYEKLIKLEKDFANQKIENLNAIANAASDIGAVMANMGGDWTDIGRVISVASDQIRGFSKVLSEVGKGQKEGFNIKNITSIIGLITQAISIVFDIIKKSENALDDFGTNAYNFRTQNALLNNRNKGNNFSDNPFITDYSGMIKAGVDQYSDAMKQYNDAIAMLDHGNAITGYRTGLLVRKSKKFITDDLLKVYPDLVDEAGNLNRELAQTLISTNQVDETTKILLQTAIAWADQAEAASDQIIDSVIAMTGVIGNDLTDAMVNAFKAGEDGAKAMSDVLGGVIESFVKNTVLLDILRPVLDEFREGVKSSYSTGGDGTILDDIMKLNSKLPDAYNIASEVMSQVNQMGKDNGMNIFGSGDDKTLQTSLQGSIRGMSEETASVLVGQFNAVRIHQAEMNNNTRNMVLQLTEIAHNTSFNRHLVRLENIENHLAKIEKGGNFRGAGL